MATEVGSLFVRIGADVSGLTAGLNQANGQLKATGQQANQAGAGLNTVGDSADAAGQKMNTMAGHAGKAHDGMKAMGLMMAGMAATMLSLPFLAVGKSALDMAMSYERGMNVLQAVTGATDAQMKQMSQTAKDLGADMTLPKTSAADAAVAMKELAKGGLSVDDTMKAAKGTLQLAAAATISEANAAEIAANMLNAFGLKGEEAGRIADLLAAAANASSAEITDLADSSKMAAGVFAMARMPVEDFITAVGLMANAGVKGSDAGTSLKQALLFLMAPTKKANELMKELGIVIYDTTGRMLPFPMLAQQFQKATEGMTDAQRNYVGETVFGRDAIRVFQDVIMKSTEEWDKMAAAVTRSGAAQELAGAQMKGLAGAIEGLQSQFETLMLNAMEPLLSGLEGLVRGVADLVGQFMTLPIPIQQIVIVGSALLGGLLALTGVVLGVASAILMLKPILTPLGPQIGAMVMPIMLVIAAVAALGFAWTTNFMDIQGKTASVASEVQARLGQVVAFLDENLGTALQVASVAAATWAAITIWHATTATAALLARIAVMIAGFIALKVEAIASAIATAAAWVVMAVPAIVAAMGAIIGAIAGAILPILAIAAVAGAVALAWSQNWGDIQGITGRVLQWVADRIKQFIDWLKGVPILGEFVKGVASHVDLAGNLLGNLVSTAGKTVDNIIAEFQGGFPSVQQAIRDMFKMPAGIGADWQAYDAVPSGGGGMPILPPIPGAPGGYSGGDDDAAGKAAKKAKEAKRDISSLIPWLVSLQPAYQAAAAAVAEWNARIVEVTQAIAANREAARAAQKEYQQMQDKLGELNKKLSTARDRLGEMQKKLSELSTPRLTGMKDMDDKINAINTQLKRIKLSESLALPLEEIIKKYPMLDKEAEKYLATMPKTEEELRKLLEQLQLIADLRFDEPMRKLKEAAEGAKKEMSYEETLKEIEDTKAGIGNLTKEIDGLTEQIEEQEAAMKKQRDVMAAIQDEGERLNDTLRIYQANLRQAESNLQLVTKALEDAARWFLIDRDNMIEMGEEGVAQAEIIDEATTQLITDISEYAGEATEEAGKAMQGVYDHYKDLVNSIELELAEIPREIITIHTIIHRERWETPAGGGGGGGEEGGGEEPEAAIESLGAMIGKLDNIRIGIPPGGIRQIIRDIIGIPPGGMIGPGIKDDIDIIIGIPPGGMIGPKFEPGKEPGKDLEKKLPDIGKKVRDQIPELEKAYGEMEEINEKAWAQIVKVVQVSIDIIGDEIEEFIAYIYRMVEAIQALYAAASRMPSPGSVVAGQGPTDSTQFREIGMAEGGIVTRPTLALIGERGPEAVVPLGRGGGGSQINVYIQAPIYGVSQVEDVIVSAIESASRKGRLNQELVA